MKQRVSLIAAATALALAAAAPVAARDDARHYGARHSAHVGSINLSGWDHSELRSGYSAERLIGMHVRDRSDRSIGEIDNMLMTRDGRITAVVVSAGGVLGLGETFYRVPWEQVRFDRRTNSVSVPISERNVELFRWGAEHVPVATNEYKVNEVMDGRVVLRDGLRYGGVDDLIIGRDGRVKALVATSSVTGSGADRFAFPYRGEIFFSAQDNAFTLPYTRDQVGALEPLDYEGLGIGASAGWGAEGRVSGSGASRR